MRYLIRGYYGSGNVGDDALIYTLTAEILKRDRSAIFDIISRNSVYLDESVNEVTDYILPSNNKIIRSLKKTDVLLFGGGGQFQNTTRRLVSKGLLKQLYLVLCAKIFKKKIYMYSVSLGPGNSWFDLKIIKLIIKLSDKVNVRDNKSLTLIDDRSLYVSNDISERISSNYFPKRKDVNTIGVTIVPINQIKYGEYEKDIAFLNKLASAFNKSHFNKNFIVKIIVFHKGDDRGDEAYSHLFATKLKEKGFKVNVEEYHENPIKMLEKVNQCNYLVGSRLHSLVFSYISQIPFMGISYHPKFEGFLQYNNLKDSLLVDIYHTNEEILVNNLNKLYNSKPPLFEQDKKNDEYLDYFFNK